MLTTILSMLAWLHLVVIIKQIIEQNLFDEEEVTGGDQSYAANLVGN